ncbi:hypothetical protein AbraIFM66951_006150 [Aspergillus brasiliensis]|uniref:F-box domain-containing protein n=1 Tax=Aspergillus brasiliensis TaxID=319629 RepID=A0A9W6DN22_9EURO|nr:hypothetical protein AbraCBS73388_007140 [Aspergillus brasiliensis]GKZ44261.1 hypothetical protein AbraIFM66951_006150 [Aspergillus brasiliensis]
MAADAAPIQQIITLFAHLNTNAARHDAYHRILDLLNPHEWRDLQRRINQRSFQKDILAESPPEIAVQIAQYLDLSDLHILQRVSRKWHQLLSSELIQGAVYQQYTGHVGAAAHFAQYAKYRIRLERGQPICNLQDPNLFPTNGSKLECLDYANGRCAWIENGTHVVVHDLCTHSNQRFCTENRDSFWDLRLSDSMVVAISARAYCHAWNLETEEHASFRLPGFSFRTFVASGLKLALSFINRSAAGDEESMIYYWDMSSRGVRTIEVTSHLALISLHPTTNSVITLLLERGDDPMNPDHSSWDRLRVVKHTFDDHGRITSPLSSYISYLPFPIELDWSTIANMSDSSTSSLAVFSCKPPPQSNTLSSSPPPPPPTRTTTTLHYVLVVSYDPQRDQVYVHTLPQEEGASYFPFCKTALDSDLLYYVKSDRGKPAIWISNPASRIPHRPAKSMSLGLPREASNGIYSYANLFTLRGDGDFILLVHEAGVKVWRMREVPPSESDDLAILAA